MKVIKIEDFCIPAEDVDYDELSNFVNEISALATFPVEAEPVRRGRWERCGIKAYDFAFYCSECCSFSPNGIKTKYCPYCGAKMEV